MAKEKNEVRGDIEFMLKSFAPERYAYLVGTIISFLLLIACLFVFMVDMIKKGGGLEKEDFVYVFGMFGSGGIIGLTASRLLKMWKDCYEMIKQNQ